MQAICLCGYFVVHLHRDSDSTICLNSQYNSVLA
nr:MAG TPA: hypothetical protein [Caudoviricetes sp.]